MSARSTVEPTEPGVEHADRRLVHVAGPAARRSRSATAAPIPDPSGRHRDHDVERLRVGGAQHAVQVVRVAPPRRRARRGRRRADRRAPHRSRRPAHPRRRPRRRAFVGLRSSRPARRGPGARSATRACRARATSPRSGAAPTPEERFDAPTRHTAEPERSRDAAREQSTMVDSTPTRHGPPSSTRSTSAPRSSRTSAAVVGLTRPKRLADGAATSPAEGAQQLERERLVGYAQPDGGEPTGHRVGHALGPGHDHGQRAGPARPRQHRADSGTVLAHCVEQRGIAEVHDHRVVGRATLHREEPVHRVGRRRVGPEPVHRLGRERDQAPGPQHGDGATDVGRAPGVRILTSS